MVSCFGRCTRKAKVEGDEAVWTPQLVQDLHRRCLQSNGGELIVYGERGSRVGS